MTSPARQVYNEPERMSVGLATQTIEDFVADLLHKPPVVLVDNVNEIVGANIRHQIRGAVFGGRIYIVRSAFADGDVGGMRRTLWHELHHYGLRRFLTEEEYTAKMLNQYSSDLVIRSYANNWAKSSVMANKLRSNGRSDEYFRARGVDEALGWLAERVPSFKTSRAATSTIFPWDIRQRSSAQPEPSKPERSQLAWGWGLCYERQVFGRAERRDKGSLQRRS